MRSETIEQMQYDVAKLVGCTLINIKVWIFHVDFVFSEALTITVRITKMFEFAFRNGEQLKFDPTREAHDPSVESSNFVFLVGMRCCRALLSQTGFELEFASGARLWIELGAKDFEPLHLIGAGGDRHEKLQFYWVL